MFSDFSSKIIEFPSCWKSEKRQREHASQTSEILTYEVESQTRRPREVACQTESLLELMEASQSINQQQQQDGIRLLQFLKAAEPIVSKQLKVNSAAVNLYTGIVKQRDLETEVELSCEYVLEEESVTSDENSDCVEVTNVSWSASGATIAVAYGTNSNIAWSDNTASICLWNLDRPKLNRRVCDQKLELESSVQVISFHPQLSGYIAAGLFSGVVLIWDLAKDDVIYSSSAHEDPVTCLSWLEEKNAKYLRLLSSSTDGKLLIWRYRKGRGSTQMQMDKRFEIRGANLPRRAGFRGAGVVGVTCMAVSGESVRFELSEKVFSTSSVVAVGCEGGSVLKCSIDVEDSNPVIFTYEGHVGPVYSVDWSPFHRHLFLTCATDQACRIYHSLQASSLREIRPEEAVGGKEANYLYSAFWSTTRPLLFFAAGTRGRIEACDVSTSKNVAFCDVTNREGSMCVVNDMKMNTRRRNMIATGSSNGLAHVWRVGSLLVEPEDGVEEQTLIDDLANEALSRD